MRKIFLSAFMILGLAFNSQAQEKNAIGIRLGDNDGFGGEVSYQRYLGKSNRLELDLGIRNNDFNHDYYYAGYNYGYRYKSSSTKLVGLYQWVWNIDNGFKWYAGPGAGVGIWSSKDYNDGRYNYKGDSGAFFVLAGDIGIEYNFDFPLQLSFDFRPEIYISDDYGDLRDGNFGPDFGISARYRF
ncbi:MULTISPECIES: hypothetical protein [Flavobacterium]|uniref:Outer membrane protein beta-barrel domain-containing protein n=1 Tax=Flavobacterium hankyongi TaxID=1176532 RepID=A0ABP8ZZK2_9FLAO|nr:hypothetical protein [Flavobacterium sp. N1846]